jgi:hypothetical protein
MIEIIIYKQDIYRIINNNQNKLHNFNIYFNMDLLTFFVNNKLNIHHFYSFIIILYRNIFLFYSQVIITFFINQYSYIIIFI